MLPVAAPPLVAGATTLPAGKRVTGFSVAHRLPTNPVPLPPPIQGALWVLSNGGNLSLWQQRRENHTTGLRPRKTSQSPWRALEMHPFCRLRRRLPRRGRFALHSAFELISISRHSIAKTSPSGGSGAIAPKGVHFQRAAGAGVWFSLPKAALPPTGGNKSHRREAAIP